MKKLLNNGKAVVSFVSVLAILAVSLLSMFTGTSFIARAEGETDSADSTVTYPLNGKYDADYKKIDGIGEYYTDVTDTYTDSTGATHNKVVSNFTGFETDFILHANGKGSASDPYIIENANQFAAVVTNRLVDANGQYVNTEFVCFKVADSVKAFNLNNTDSTVDFSGNMSAADVEAALKNATVNSGLTWSTPNGNIAFRGRFDGNGVVVYGLKAEGENAGIFPIVCGNITIRNLTVKNCYFRGNNASVFMALNKKLSDYAYSNAAMETRNCAAYGNAVICNFDKESIERAGILCGYVPYDVSMKVIDCLAYGNIAKHETRNITYGLVGRLHRSTSATIENTITMDAVPHTLYYGSNAFHTSTFTNVYTNTMNGQEWTNWDTTFDSNGNMQGSGKRYVYKYSVNDAGQVTASFNHYDRNGTNLTYNGNGYSRTIEGPVYNVQSSAVIGTNQLKGIDSAKWTYKEGSYPTPKVYHIREYTSGEPWSGESAVKYFEGEGTQSAPYVITNAEELAYMLLNENENKFYKLGNDIVINDTSSSDWIKTAKKWFTSNDVPAFKGNIDGAGHTVSGIYFDGSQAGEFAGLIPVVGSPAAIKNIKVVNSSIAANKGAAGGLAGQVEDRAKKVIKFDAITIEDTVKFTGNAAKGGIVGKIGYSVANISDCITKSAGIFGDTEGVVRVNRCISVNNYPFGKTTNVTAKNIYTNVDGDRLAYTDTDGNEIQGITVLNIDDMKGSAAATNMSGLNFPTLWKTVADDFPTPTAVAASSEGARGEVWSGAVATSFAGGDGSAANPYLIETAEQLALCVRDNNPSVPVNYRLTADIYLNDVNSPLWEEKIGCNEWYTQRTTKWYSNFRNAVFDGDGYVVYGLFYDHTGPQTEYVRVGLFPQIGEGTTIKNLAVSQVYISLNRDIIEDDAGCIVGVIDYWNNGLYPMDPNDAEANAIIKQNPDFQARQPKFINCLADHTCYVSTERSGGILGTTGGPVYMENCIFTGTLSNRNDIYYGGTMVGMDWSYGTTLVDCVSLPQCGSIVMGGSSVSTWRSSALQIVTTANDLYYFATKQQGGLGNQATKILKPEQRVGEAARSAMPGLDWVDSYNYDPSNPDSDETTWLVVDGGTPLPAVFSKHKTKEQYEKLSDKEFKAPFVTVSFMTDTDEVTVDDMTGRMYSKINLPIISRPGYIFTGWYVFDDHSIEYPKDYFPPRDLTLYAGWESNGVTQNFEKYTDTVWDYDDTQWRLNKPGAKGGYKNAYVRNGSRSMHLLDTNTEPADMLLNYEEMLEPGQAYTMTFWVSTDKANNPATLLTLVHNSKPVYLDTQVAAENMAVVTGLKVGEWVQYSYSFTAQTKWVSIRATGNSSLYFDDIVIGKIDGTLNGGNLIGLGTGGAGSGSLSPNTGDVVSVAALISAIVAGAVVVVISRKNSAEVID